MIQAYLVGKPSLDKFESLTNEKVIDDCMWLLEKFLGKSLPRPKNMKRTDWLTNRNFYGVYSFMSLDSERTESTPMILAESLLNNEGRPSILFAGEATHEKYSGYTHGAVQTGWRAAAEISNLYAG